MLPQSIPGRLAEFRELDQKIRRLGDIGATLSWDQETYLPQGGVPERSEQLALLEGMAYELRTSHLMGSLVHDLENATLPTEEDRALVREHKRSYDRTTRLSKDLVERRARLVGLAQNAWAEARKVSDFKAFSPYLTEIVDISREIAEKIGYKDHPYDALLEEYEPFTSSAQVKEVFDKLQGPLSNLSKRISEKKQQDDSFLHRDFPKASQEILGRQVITDMGFDWNAGRVDVTTHPFCTTLGPRDIRLTTRYDEHFFNTSFYGMIHEAGHGLYEQGVGEKLYGTMLAGGASLGIHESQSRFWENMVARSRPFIQHYFPRIQQTFPQALKGVSPEQFYRGINRVESSFIRVEADEVTYGLHIILRFNLERALLDGTLKVEDVPEAWNTGFKDLLGIIPENDAQGCLQDVHWSMGGIGYFPTYTLGNLYAAQFLNKMRQDIPDWTGLVSTGSFSPLLDWLRKNIHVHGKVYPAGELVKKVTGEALNPDYFINYLESKYGDIYEL